MKSINKVISLCLVLFVLCSAMSVFAATGTNDMVLETVLRGDTEKTVKKVFVGEFVETSIDLSAFEAFSGFDIVLMYDNTVLKVASYTDDSEITADIRSGNFVNGSEGVKLLDAVKRWTKSTNNVFPTYGIVMLGRSNKTETVSGNVADFAAINFKAVAAGMPNVRFASTTADSDAIYEATGQYDLELANKNGYKFSSANGMLADVTADVSSVEILEKPEEPQAVTWTEYKATWTEPETGSRGYEITIYKDGVPVAENVKVVDACEYDIWDIIKAEGIGSYDFKVRALGADYHSEFVGPDEPKVVNKFLVGRPEVNFDEDTKELTWEPTENAESYTVTIKAEGQEDITIDLTDTTINLSDKFAVGDYTITVTAKNSNTALYDPATSEPPVAYSTGSTITGTISYETNNNDIKNNCDTIVTLTDDSDEENVVTYSAVVAEDGTFAIVGVPEGDYTVSISRRNALTRTFSEKLSVKSKSIVKDICATGKTISIRLGDVDKSEDTLDVIGQEDLSDTIGVWGLLKADDETSYNANAHIDMVLPEAGDLIDVEEVNLIVKYFGASSRRLYAEASYLAEYDFMIE